MFCLLYTDYRSWYLMIITLVSAELKEELSCRVLPVLGWLQLCHHTYWNWKCITNKPVWCLLFLVSHWFPKICRRERAQLWRCCTCPMLIAGVSCWAPWPSAAAAGEEGGRAVRRSAVSSPGHAPDPHHQHGTGPLTYDSIPTTYTYTHITRPRPTITTLRTCITTKNVYKS